MVHPTAPYHDFSHDSPTLLHPLLTSNRIYDNLDRPSGFTRLALDTVAASAPPAVKFSLKAIYNEVTCKSTPREEFARLQTL